MIILKSVASQKPTIEWLTIIIITPKFCKNDTLQKKLSQLPAVEMQNAPAKLPSKLHLSAYVDLLAQSLCIKPWLNHSWRKVWVTPQAPLEFLQVVAPVALQFFGYKRMIDQIKFIIGL